MLRNQWHEKEILAKVEAMESGEKSEVLTYDKMAKAWKMVSKNKKANAPQIEIELLIFLRFPLLLP
jgi:hypothetical protein